MKKQLVKEGGVRNNKFFSIEKTKNHKIIYFLGIKLKLRLKSEPIQESRILENVFNKDFKKSVLLSYIKSPFVSGLQKNHTNYLECYSVAKIFDELNYKVDVIEYNESISKEEALKYEVIYGFGYPYTLSLSNPNIKSIYYGTGCSLNYSLVQTIKKTIDFAKEKGVWLPESSRFVDLDSVSITNFSDLIITLGNDFVKNTYAMPPAKKDIKIKNLNLFYYDTYNINIENKNFKNIKKNFLYFGSSGALHKGLDIIIDIFKNRKDLNLTICGISPYEKDFIDYYKDVFQGKYNNIKSYDYVNIESSLFKKIMDTHIAVISPSVSEGGAAAVLTVMANGGLIPIISKNSGLDVNHYGFMFDEISIDAVNEKINKFLSMDEKNLEKISLEVKNETRENYSYENYYNNLKRIISDELKS